MYRIKTEKEFEEEFGSNWRSNVRYGFLTDMDFLLGEEITKDIYKEIQESDSLYKEWRISKDMVKKCGRYMTSVDFSLTTPSKISSNLELTDNATVKKEPYKNPKIKFPF